VGIGKNCSGGYESGDFSGVGRPAGAVDREASSEAIDLDFEARKQLGHVGHPCPDTEQSQVFN
jgi:hypothetical protein